MIYVSKAIPSKLLVPTLLLVMAFMTAVVQTQAKSSRPPGTSYLAPRDAKMRRGGCASFGHSCFGGHGKRAVPASGSGDPEELPTGDRRQNEATSLFLGDGSRPRLEIFSRDEGQMDASDADLFLRSQFRKPEYLHLTPFLRNWLRSVYQRQDTDADK